MCAVGTCFTQGADCTRCHGRNTLPGLKLNCRGGSRAESAAYAAGLALHQQRLTARRRRDRRAERVRARAPAHARRAAAATTRTCSSSVQRTFATHSTAATGEFVLAAGRLTPEKGFADVVDACAQAGLALVIAGDGPQRAELEARATGDVRFTGQIPAAELAALRARAAVAVVPSRYAEILPLAALEAMAAALPTVAARSGGLTEAVPEEGLYPPGDVDALAQRLTALYGDAAGRRARARRGPRPQRARGHRRAARGALRRRPKLRGGG